jgi:ABC-type Zn uptake system ZnuABC Zn-binding protein ZnuA
MKWVLPALLALIIAGCDDEAQTPSPVAQRRISVVAPTYPLADIARQVAGSRADVHWWIESGQSVAGFQPTEQQLDQARTADVVVSSGVEEAYITELFSQMGGDRRLIRVDGLLDPAERAPKLWMDPAAAKTVANAVAERCAVLQMDHSTTFRAAATDYQKNIDALMSDFDTRLIGLENTIAASIGQDYSVLCRVAKMSAVVVSESAPARLDDAEMASIARKIRDARAVLVLVEADTPPTVVKNLAAKFDVPVVTIDSIGSSNTERNSYEKLMRYNFEQLYDGWRRGMKR